ncbi:hypothetical protein M9H77_25662 [Catharanthus roseus]|uniref:Uncharacterized protein n=1 Tax=Catharanthus roseus TaxID=4058 RepID=A0ACC0A8C3_CATRO|nr:hypothetical protein M9H77_25662 [Catharanthus roseus]
MSKVLWRHHGIEEATWETKEFLYGKYSEILGPLLNDMLGRCTLDLDPVDRGRSTIGGLGPRRRGSPANVVQGGLVGTLGFAACFVYKWCILWFMKSNVRLVCFGFPAGIDYRIPKLVIDDPI